MEEILKNKFLKKVLSVLKKTIEILLALSFVIFEEVIWEYLVIPVKNFLNRVVKENVVVVIESLNKYIILLIFLGILIVAEGLGLVSGALLIQGLVLLSIIVYVIKIAVAGVTFWLFGIAKEKLLSITAFAYGYEKVIAAKEWIESRKIYIDMKKKAKEISMKIKSKIKSDGEFKRVYMKIKEIFKKKEEE